MFPWVHGRLHIVVLLADRMFSPLVLSGMTLTPEKVNSAYISTLSAMGTHVWSPHKRVNANI